MYKSMRRVTVTIAAILLVVGLVFADWLSPTAVRAAPPEGQTYVGAKACASCHFEQYMVWKKTKHALTFEDLPDEHKTDATCLKCHTTGFGQPTGFKDIASTPQLAGNTCESCHGPGSEHAKIAKTFGDKALAEDEEKQVRGSVWLIHPDNACARCHSSIGHKAHEKFEKE